MPYQQSLENLRDELLNQKNNLCLFLQTNTNIYSFRSELTHEQQLELIRPISDNLVGREYVEYDALERLPDTVYYITEQMPEYESLNDIEELNRQIRAGDIEIATIRSIEQDKIKMVIFEKEEFLFLYKYNTGKLFKQGWKAIFNDEEAIVEKDDNSTLVLSKTVPDIIVDTINNIAFILNVTQAEYILEITSLFTNSLNIFGLNLREFNLMSEDTIGDFIGEISSKNSYMRKLHKINTTQSYQYFRDNINKIPDVLAQYNLNVNFNEDSGKIIFDEETNVGDVLHLFADDYIKRYISDRDDVMK